MSGESGETPYREANALLAAQQQDEAGVKAILEDMTIAELRELGQACMLLRGLVVQQLAELRRESAGDRG